MLEAAGVLAIERTQATTADIPGKSRKSNSNRDASNSRSISNRKDPNNNRVHTYQGRITEKAVVAGRRLQQQGVSNRKTPATAETQITAEIPGT